MPSTLESATQYIPIRIGTLRAGHLVDFDTFIEIDQHLVHYARAGEAVDSARVDSLRQRGVQRLFIHVTDNAAYLRYLERGLEDLNDETMPIRERGGLAADVLCTDADNALRNFSQPLGFKAAQERLQKSLFFMMDSRGALENILQATGSSKDVGQHCAHTAVLSMGLALACGERSHEGLLHLGLAGLIHDAALVPEGRHAEPSLFQTRKLESELDPDTRARYQEHPLELIARLTDKTHVPQEILSLIADHEEVGVGQGYPHQKSIAQLPLRQQIFNLCNRYDRFAGRHGLCSSRVETLTLFEAERDGAVPIELLRRLRELLGGALPGQSAG